MQMKPINHTIYFLFYRNDSFVDPTPEIQKELKSELERVAKVSMIGKKKIAHVFFKSNCFVSVIPSNSVVAAESICRNSLISNSKSQNWTQSTWNRNESIQTSTAAVAAR